MERRKERKDDKKENVNKGEAKKGQKNKKKPS